MNIFKKKKHSTTIRNEVTSNTQNDLNYTIRIETYNDDYALLNYATLEEAMRRLNVIDGSFVVLQASKKINNVTYMQATYYFKSQNIFNETFHIEVQEQLSDGSYKNYYYETKDFNECNEIFRLYYVEQKVPDLRYWKELVY